MKQREIISAIAPDFAREGESRAEYIERKKTQIVNWVAGYVKKCGTAGVVLGVSGGIDSFLAGSLCALAMAKLQKTLRLVILPNGEQADYKDALDSVEAIKKLYPQTVADTVSIGGGYEAAREALSAAAGFTPDAYTLGNLQPRLRMTYQYALAKNMLVIGTDHAAEAVTGFYTKYGDGGSDINPLQELLKDDIYEMSALFGAPEAVMKKRPAAGLGITEDDESELGMSYADICAYLRGNVIDTAAAKKLESIYERSEHKRALPSSPRDVYTLPNTECIVCVDLVGSFIDMEMPCINAKRAVKASVAYINAHPGAQVFYVRDLHPKNHCSFLENGGIWPPHAVDGTRGADFHPSFYKDIKKTVNTPIEHYNVFNKGTDEAKEQYSSVMAKNTSFGLLADNLGKNVTVLGAATEYCVMQTVFELLERGFHVTVPEFCLAYVDGEGHETALERMKSEGARILY